MQWNSNNDDTQTLSAEREQRQHKDESDQIITTMSNNKPSADEHRHDTNSDSTTDTKQDTPHLLDRRDYLKFTGVAAVAGLGATGGATAADYDTVTVSSGETKRYNLGDGDTLKNKLIDVTADGASLRIRPVGSGWTIRNIGVKGRPHGWNIPDTSYFIAPTVTEGGTGVIENVYLGDGANAEDDFMGIFVGIEHAGTVKIRNCNIQHMPNNGVYGAPPGRSAPSDGGGGGGAVKIEQSYARNNNLDGFRVGTDGSYVKDSVVHVDKAVPYAYRNDDAVNARGIWVKEGGDCDIKNCDIHLEHRDGSACIWEGDNEEQGVARVSNSELRASANDTRLYEGNVTKSNIGHSPDVSVPDSVPQSAAQAAKGNSGGGGGGGGGDELPNRITIKGRGPGNSNYSFNVSGDLNPAEPSRGEEGADAEDSHISGASVGNGGTDAFRFSGDIGYFNCSGGDLLMTVNGTVIDNPETHWDDGGNGGNLPNRITIKGNGPGQTNYSFNVSGDLNPAEPSRGEGEASDAEDSHISGASVNAGGTDAFRFSGSIGYFNHSGGDILVTMNGTVIDNPENHWG